LYMSFASARRGVVWHRAQWPMTRESFGISAAE
jgi:hypothetical protein